MKGNSHEGRRSPATQRLYMPFSSLNAVETKRSRVWLRPARIFVLIPYEKRIYPGWKASRSEAATLGGTKWETSPPYRATCFTRVELQ